MKKINWPLVSFVFLTGLVTVAFWAGVVWLSLGFFREPKLTESQALEYYDVLNSFTFASSSVDVNVEGLTR